MPNLKDAQVSPGKSDQKALAIGDKTTALNAYCLSSYGIYYMVDSLSPSAIKEVLSNTPPTELEMVASMLKDHMRDLDPCANEGEVKDLAYKREVILKMAGRNENKTVVEPDEDGKFRSTAGEE